MTTTWTDELRAAVIAEYVAAEATPETTAAIIKQIADDKGFSPNGVRGILTRAEVYVSQVKAKAASGEPKAKKKSKQESLDELTALMKEGGVEVDDAIVNKLTGKAAEFFIGAINTCTG